MNRHIASEIAPLISNIRLAWPAPDAMALVVAGGHPAWLAVSDSLG